MSLRTARSARVPRYAIGNRPGRQQPSIALAKSSSPRSGAYADRASAEDHGHVARRVEQPGVDGPGGDGVLDVVDRVGHVVGPVHDVGFETSHARFDARPEPVVDRHVGRIHAELPGGPDGLAAGPRVLRRRVEAGPGEVETGGTAVRVGALGLEPGEDAQRLGVPLEPADAGRDGVQRLLAVVTERRVAEVVGEAGGVDDVRVAAERGAELPPDLGDLEGVGEPGAREVVAARLDDLGLRRQPAQRCGVDQPRPVAREVVAVGPLVCGVLRRPSARGPARRSSP